ncbi:MAG: diguanylate cyclase [Deltaproteobacteria bacterium]|nr:diguanylate cyclase [Deltaproteobacteria bacterium]
MKNPSILVVDDEPFFRHLYADALSENNCNVEKAASGEEALKRIMQGGIDVVLTDLIMPGISGLDLLRAVRKIINPPEVILVTAHATIETAIEALKNGARDYLIKPFNPEELRHLVHTCLEQRQLLNENIHLKNQIRLYQKGQSLAFLLEVEKLLPQAVDFLSQEAAGGNGFAFLLENDIPNKFFCSEGISEEQASVMTASMLAKFRNLIGTSFLQIQDIDIDSQWPPGIHSLCLIPLLFEKEFKGGIVIFNSTKAGAEFHLPYEQLLFLAQQTSLGFSNSCRFQGTQELVYTDDLTGLYNYRYLHVILQQEIQRTERYGLSFALVFIDLDHFKEVNDTYGHLVGSNTLKEVAEIIRLSVRSADMVFRYGGDEFTALLVETDKEGAATVTERIRRNIANHTFQKDAIAFDKLTATLGYATFPENAKEKKELMDLADKAMYHGKKQRNVVCSVADLS